jgi:hypothetical protein
VSCRPPPKERSFAHRRRSTCRPVSLGRAVARRLVADRMRSASFGEARDVVTQRVLQRSDGALEWESPGRERSAHAV